MLDLFENNALFIAVAALIVYFILFVCVEFKPLPDLQTERTTPATPKREAIMDRLDVMRYPSGPDEYCEDLYELPTWELVGDKLHSMDRFDQPILAIKKNREWPDSNLLCVIGGNGAFYIQVADHDVVWFRAFDPHGSDELVDVWTSDVGMSVEKNLTWPLKDARKMVRHYYETGDLHPEYAWTHS